MAVETLGCGTYEAHFKERGGHTFVGRARDLTSLSWQRRLNDVSEAHITFSLSGDESATCCGLAAIVNPWEHELSIYREGNEIWCGPVSGGEINEAEMTATFDAKDLSAWFDHRWVEPVDTDVEFDEVDVTVVFNWLIEHGYSKDPFNLEWFVGDPLQVPLTREYISFDPPGERWGGVYPNIGTELRDLVKSRIDYTTIRRVLIAGDLQTATANNPVRLMDRAWETQPKITIVGSGMATEQGVGGGNGGYYGYDDTDMWIERPNDDARQRFGLLQNFEAAPDLDEEDTSSTPNMVTQRAVELRSIRSEPFIYLQGGTLSQNAPVTFDQLIPGRRFRVDLSKSCREVHHDYLLTEVNVSLGDGAESVAITLVPPGLSKVAA